MQARMAGFLTAVAVGLGVTLVHLPKTTSYASEQSPAKVERLDPAADAIIPVAAMLQKLATGYTWTEGPIWMQEGYLLFADIPSNTIRKLR